MTPEELSTEDAELQFDRAEPEEAAPAVTCAACRVTVATEYYDVNAATLCSGCKEVIERHAAPVTEWRLLVRAGLLGLLAAIVGAAVYYGVIAATGFEIGIVAILIGYLVGHALRKGTRGRGGRRDRKSVG